MIFLIIIISIIFFFIGASIGSFISALCYRLYNEIDFVKKRSVCESCAHVLGFFDLIPVFSFLFLRGKCRYCKKKLSAEYILAEIVLGIFFVLAFLQTKDLLIYSGGIIQYIYFIFLLFNISFFFFIGLFDLKYYVILDISVYTLSILYLLVIVGIYALHLLGINFLFYTNYTYFFLQHILTGSFLFLFFLLIYLLTKEKGIGGGDVKLSFLIGLLLGIKPTIIFLYAAFFIGAIVSVILLLTKVKHMKDAIPFGPFLSLGVIIALLYSGIIIQTSLFNFLSYIP